MNTVVLNDVYPKSIYGNNPEVVNSISIVLNETKQNYLLSLNATQALSIDTSQLSSKKDIYQMTFNLEIVANGHYAINLAGCNIEQMEFYQGVSELKFTKSPGDSVWKVDILKNGGIAPYYYREGINYRREVCLYPCTSRAETPLLGYFSTPTTINSDNIRQTFEGTDIYFDGVSLNPFILTQLNVHVQNTNYGTEAAHPEQMFLYGSNDYKNWTLLYSDTNLDWKNKLGTIQTYTPSIIRPFKCLRFRFIQSTAYKITLSPMSLIGIGSELLYCGAIVQFPAITGAINGYDVSINTSDGVALADSTTVYGCTNGNSTSLTRSNSALPWEIIFTYPSAVRPVGFRIGKYSDLNANTPDWFAWYGSDDGTNWTKAIELRGVLKIAYSIAGSNDYEDYMCDFGSSHKYWKLCVYEAKTATATKIRVKEAYPLTPLYQYSIFESIVPKLSTDEQEGYTVSASSTTDGAAYKMYDQDSSTYCGGSITDGAWTTTINMGESVIIRGIQMQTTSSADRMPTTFKVQGSSDGASWTDISTQTLGSTFWTSLTSGTIGNFEFPNDTAYQYYRLYVTATAQGTYVRICELGWTTKLRGNPINYYTDEYLVPIMSQNSQDGYVASAKTYYSNEYAPWLAFNRTTTGNRDCWVTAESEKSDSNYNVDTWLQIQLPQATVANEVTMVGRYGNSSEYLKTPRDWKLQGSNDGSTWTDLLTVTDQVPTSSAQSFTYKFENTTAYLYYRAAITRISLANQKASVSQLNISKYTYYNN